MIEGTPWSSNKTIAGLSKEPIGLELAERVASKLVTDRGRRGIWYTHRDYCGHGLVFLEEKICLVEYSDGFPKEGSILNSWGTKSGFVNWLKDQSDHSLSGADEKEKEIYTNNPFTLNNQRITRKRLKRYLAGEPNP